MRYETGKPFSTLNQYGVSCAVGSACAGTKGRVELSVGNLSKHLVVVSAQPLKSLSGTRSGTNQFLGHIAKDHIVTRFLFIQFYDAQLCGFEVWRGFHPHRYTLRIFVEDVLW